MLNLSGIYLRTSIIFWIFLFITVSLEVYFIKSDLIYVILFLTFLVYMFLFYLFISKLSKNLEKEVDKITQFLKQLTKKSKIETIESNFSKEFNDITKLLSKIAHILVKQDKYKSSYTAKLEQSNKQKDEIISAISHEFKNPIAVINGYSQTLLSDDLPKSLRNKFLLKIKNNGEKLTDLIDTLRLATKLNENKQKFNFSDVDVYELTKEVIEDLNEVYDREIVLSGEHIVIKADKVLFGVAIKNLIENGIKYSEDVVYVEINQKYLSVIDKGIGIKSEDIKKITNKFYRVSNNVWNNSLGLGLSIVSNIVKDHNFKLEIKSELHKGSEFRIVF